jgi:hypothetical protein
MDLIMNSRHARPQLLRAARYSIQGKISKSSFYGRITQSLNDLDYTPTCHETAELADRLRDMARQGMDRMDRARRSGTVTNRSSAIELGTRMHETAMNILKGREYSDKDKETVRNREQTKRETYGMAYGANPNLIKRDLAALEARLSVDPMLRVSLDQLNNPPQEESKMNESNNIGVVKVVTYVDGHDITDLTDEQIFGKIQDIENQINDLGNIKVKSTKLDARVKELNKAIRGLVKLVDAR